MSRPPSAWIDIALDSAGADVRVTAWPGDMSRPPAHTLGVKQEQLASFASDVGRAVRLGAPLPEPTREQANRLHEALFQGDVRDKVKLLAESSGGRLLVRLMIQERDLQAIPWEAMCRAGAGEGFLASGPNGLLVARGVTCDKAWTPRHVRGPLRVLAVAPSSDEAALRGLRMALAEPVESGEIQWLDPITGEQAARRHLFERLRRGPIPHVLHFVGHGGINDRGEPELRLADNDDGEEDWLDVRDLAAELEASFRDELRLLVLEACEGAAAGALGSAAEVLARAGADGVIAYLWPVKADTARHASESFYRALTGRGHARGDVAESLCAARRSLLLQKGEGGDRGAEGLSPVLYLRATDSLLWMLDEPLGDALSLDGRIEYRSGRHRSAGASRPRNELFERVVRVCELREKARGRTYEISRRSARSPFHDIAEVRFSEAFGGVGTYGVVALRGEVDESALDTLRTEIVTMPHIHWIALVHDGPPIPEEIAALGGLKIRIASLTHFEELIDFRPYVKRQTDRLTTDSRYRPERYVSQTILWSIGHDAERRIEDAASELRMWMAVPGPVFALVLGDFGTGKTFLLHELARRLGHEGGPLVPILIRMQDLEKARSLDVLVAQHLALTGMEQINLEAFRYLLREGRLVLLFDGYDELALRVTFERAAEHLGTLVQAAIGNAKVVLTSRTQHFYSDRQVKLALLDLIEKTGGYRLARLQPFTEQQIHAFLVKRLESEAAAADRVKLLDEVKDLLGLSKIPRMLDFIAELPEAELRAARDKTGTVTAAALYERLLDWWFRNEDRRVRQRGAPPNLTASDRWAAVSSLAMRLWATTEQTVHYTELPAAAGAAIQNLSARQINEEEAGAAVGSGTLLVRDGEGNFAFLHQSVMEWLVAKRAAGEVASAGESAALVSREISPLMTDFFAAIVGREPAIQWARGVLGAEGGASEVASKNALRVLDRLDASPQPGLRLANQDLRGQDFSGRDLREADLSAADLRMATLVGANLSRARLVGAKLAGADLSQVKLHGADLTDADLTRARLLGAKLLGAKLAGAKLRYAKLVGASVDEAALAGCDTFGAAFPRPAHVEPFTDFSASQCNSVAWSPDGACIATGHESGAIGLWDVATGALVRVLQGHAGSVNCVAWSPDGRVLASGSNDTTILLWEASSGEHCFTLRGHSDGVTSVAFASDGVTLASGSLDWTIGLWDAVSGVRRLTLTGHLGSVTTVAFSPDGATLASGSQDETIVLWDMRLAAPRLVLAEHSSWITSVAFASDGGTLASGSQDETIRLWDVASGDLRLTLAGPPGHVMSVAFAFDGVTLASGSDAGAIRLWDVASGDLRRTLVGHSSNVTSVAFAADGLTLASGSSDTTLRLWDVISGAGRAVVKGHSVGARSVAFTSDGRTLASASDDKTIRLWDAAPIAGRLTLEGHSHWVNHLAFTADGLTLASASSDNTIRLWDVTSGAHRFTLKGHSNSVTSVAFAPDGHTLASGSNDESIRLWDATSGTPRWKIKGHTRSITSVAFTADGLTLASASTDCNVRLWDMASHTLRFDLAGHASAVTSVAFTASGLALAAGCGNGAIWLWNAGSGAGRSRYTAQSSPVTGVAFSPDGRTLASASRDKRIHLWDAGSDTPRLTLHGHSDSVNGVAFTPDGLTLASASSDGTVRLWDVETGQCLAVLLPRENGWAAFTPGGRYKLSGDIGGAFWFVIGLCRFEPGELDPYLPNIQRIPDDEPLLLPRNDLPPVPPTVNVVDAKPE